MEQVICTPHLGASTGEAQVNVAVAIAQQVADFLCRGVIQNAVNVPSLSPEVLRVLRPYLLLAEKLGALQAQLLPEPPVEVTVQASGEVAERELRSLAAAVLRGGASARSAAGAASTSPASSSAAGGWAAWRSR